MTKPVFETTLTAASEHIDELGHVNNAVWVQWVQQIAVAHWESVATPAHRQSYHWVVVRHEIDYLRPARQGDRIGARTWVGEPRRAPGSTALSNSAARTAESVFDPGLSGRSSTGRSADRSAFPPKSWHPSFQQCKQAA